MVVESSEVKVLARFVNFSPNRLRLGEIIFRDSVIDDVTYPFLSMSVGKVSFLGCHMEVIKSGAIQLRTDELRFVSSTLKLNDDAIANSVVDMVVFRNTVFDQPKQDTLSG